MEKKKVYLIMIGFIQQGQVLTILTHIGSLKVTSATENFKTEQAV